MKKFLAILTLSTLFFPQNSFAFDDISPISPYYVAIENLANRGIITRDRENYLPNNPLTRAELAKVSLLAAGIEIEKATEIPFPDLTANWMNDILFTAKKYNIIEGYTDGKFRPDISVTYVEAFKIMAEALGYEAAETANNLYEDAQKTDWWTKYIERAYNRNLLSKETGSVFGIHRPFTRNILAQMLYRDLLIEDHMTDVFSSRLEEKENLFQDMDDLDDTMNFDIDMDFTIN